MEYAELGLTAPDGGDLGALSMALGDLELDIDPAEVVWPHDLASGKKWEHYDKY